MTAPRPRLCSTVYACGPSDPPTGQVAEDRNRRARAALWHREGLVVMDPAEVADEWLRQAAINYAQDRYGRRGGRT